MIDKEIDSVLREIKDFPNKGINFKDITSLLLYPKLGSKILDSLAAKLNSTKLDAIVGVESRGFLFGYSLAMKLQIPFVPARKGGKLPGSVVQTKYSLEYDQAILEIHKNDIKSGWNILIHDDLLATGGTAVAASELIQMLGANVAGYAFLISLKKLNGDKKLSKFSDNIISLVNY